MSKLTAFLKIVFLKLSFYYLLSVKLFYYFIPALVLTSTEYLINYHHNIYSQLKFIYRSEMYI